MPGADSCVLDQTIDHPGSAYTLESMRISRILNLLFTCLLLGAVWVVASQQLRLADQIGNTLSGSADAGSECAAINSGMHYYKRGFLSYAGLPDLAYPKDKLYVDPKDEPTNIQIYTHYPPGPNWLVGVGIHLCGPNNFPCYRRMPIFFTSFSLIVSYIIVAAVVGFAWSSILFIGLLQIPMTSAMMHGLHYQGYALALIVLQMAFAWYVLATRKMVLKWHLATLFLLSFLQGWLSFDYFFIATLFPLPIAFLRHPMPSVRNMILTTVASLAGFTSAIALHFCQVAIYAASKTPDGLWNVSLSALPAGFEGAYQDFFRAAVVRSSGVENQITPIGFVLRILERYLTELLPSESQGGQVGVWLLGAALGGAMVFLLGTYLFKASHSSMRKGLQPLFSLLLALCISLLWVVIMRNHALDGTHLTFLPRHFIVLLWVSGALLVSGGHNLVVLIAAYVRRIVGRRKAAAQ